MARIYIIAGAPGAGKSTSGRLFIPKGLEILDSDDMSLKYKIAGYTDFKEMGQLKFNRIFNNRLFSNANFAIELNLGFEHHYNYVKRIKQVNSENEIIVVLFHTDDVNLCLDRAKMRAENGRHFVAPDVIQSMYDNIFPLFNKYKDRFSGLIAVNVEKTGNTYISMEYDFKNKKALPTLPLPDWVKREFKELIRDLSPQIKRLPRRNPLPPPDDPDEPKKSRGFRR
ncbi:hypothetical protein [Rhizosphaericola mali]|uniref:UDP-N-acetylglucosamine kinase n=1 Tax=Rhizosphaericola mali TaxID=2545455 RepID=A0A5P2FX09_9BACT|nr:hypothetical protein [Rhizosphaericola mali]QES88056.1 hypothetical protein E0W69_005050 [Rhizosphaericola mali]